MSLYNESSHSYHPDHLGSTAMVTDVEGRITQNVAYIPFGEVFVEERDGNWSTPYLFNAKEMDSETGLYYYGARYLDPTAAMWMTVDPLFEKYPGMSPYNYCAGNPVMLVDPDGRNWVKREVEGYVEIYYDRNVSTNEDLVNQGQENARVLRDGECFKGFYFFNDKKNNKYGTVWVGCDRNSPNFNPVSLTNSGVLLIQCEDEKYDIFVGTADNCLDARSLHRNRWGTSYTGDKNPLNYDGSYSYIYKPHKWVEHQNASRAHDIEYDGFKAEGPDAFRSDVRVRWADLRLGATNLAIFLSPKLMSPKQRFATGATAIAGLGLCLWKCYKVGVREYLKDKNGELMDTNCD